MYREADKTLYLDRRIKCIRDKLAEKIGEASFDFYDYAKIYSLWNLSASEEDSDEFDGLKFKKTLSSMALLERAKRTRLSNLQNLLFFVNFFPIMSFQWINT